MDNQTDRDVRTGQKIVLQKNGRWYPSMTRRRLAIAQTCCVLLFLVLPGWNSGQNSTGHKSHSAGALNGATDLQIQSSVLRIEFDRNLQPACPSQLTAPVLHKVLNYPSLQPYIFSAALFQSRI